MLLMKWRMSAVGKKKPVCAYSVILPWQSTADCHWANCFYRIHREATRRDGSSALKTLTRDDLAEAVRKEVGFSKVESRQLVDFVLESVVQALERGEDVKLTNFGVFEIRQKSERIGRNPRTGETATITPRRTITFRASSNVKAKVERG